MMLRIVRAALLCVAGVVAGCAGGGGLAGVTGDVAGADAWTVGDGVVVTGEAGAKVGDTGAVTEGAVTDTVGDAVTVEDAGLMSGVTVTGAVVVADRLVGDARLGDFSPLPSEPDEFDVRELDAYYDWRNDMFFREFDMDGNGVVNFMTARRTYKVWLDEFGTPVVVTAGAPLFYWLDRNGNGTFETGDGEMWSDPAEDGITGDERLYDTSHLEAQPSRVPRWVAPSP